MQAEQKTTMTVASLIAALQELPADSLVIASYDCGCAQGNISGIELEYSTDHSGPAVALVVG